MDAKKGKSLADLLRKPKPAKSALKANASQISLMTNKLIPTGLGTTGEPKKSSIEKTKSTKTSSVKAETNTKLMKKKKRKKTRRKSTLKENPLLALPPPEENNKSINDKNENPEQQNTLENPQTTNIGSTPPKEDSPLKKSADARRSSIATQEGYPLKKRHSIAISPKSKRRQSVVDKLIPLIFHKTENQKDRLGERVTNAQNTRRKSGGGDVTPPGAKHAKASPISSFIEASKRMKKSKKSKKRTKKDNKNIEDKDSNLSTFHKLSQGVKESMIKKANQKEMSMLEKNKPDKKEWLPTWSKKAESPDLQPLIVHNTEKTHKQEEKIGKKNRNRKSIKNKPKNDKHLKEEQQEDGAVNDMDITNIAEEKKRAQKKRRKSIMEATADVHEQANNKRRQSKRKSTLIKPPSRNDSELSNIKFATDYQQENPITIIPENKRLSQQLSAKKPSLVKTSDSSQRQRDNQSLLKRLKRVKSDITLDRSSRRSSCHDIHDEYRYAPQSSPVTNRYEQANPILLNPNVDLQLIKICPRCNCVDCDGLNRCNKICSSPSIKTSSSKTLLSKKTRKKKNKKRQICKSCKNTPCRCIRPLGNINSNATIRSAESYVVMPTTPHIEMYGPPYRLDYTSVPMGGIMRVTSEYIPGFLSPQQTAPCPVYSPPPIHRNPSEQCHRCANLLQRCECRCSSGSSWSGATSQPKCSLKVGTNETREDQERTALSNLHATKLLSGSSIELKQAKGANLKPTNVKFHQQNDVVCCSQASGTYYTPRDDCYVIDNIDDYMDDMDDSDATEYYYEDIYYEPEEHLPLGCHCEEGKCNCHDTGSFRWSTQSALKPVEEKHYRSASTETDAPFETPVQETQKETKQQVQTGGGLKRLLDILCTKQSEQTINVPQSEQAKPAEENTEIAPEPEPPEEVEEEEEAAEQEDEQQIETVTILQYSKPEANIFPEAYCVTCCICLALMWIILVFLTSIWKHRFFNSTPCIMLGPEDNVTISTNTSTYTSSTSRMDNLYVCETPFCQDEADNLILDVFQPETIDKRNPCENFYNYVCQSRLRKKKPSVDQKLRRQLIQTLIDALENKTATSAAHELYNSCIESSLQPTGEAREQVKKLLKSFSVGEWTMFEDVITIYPPIWVYAGRLFRDYAITPLLSLTLEKNFKTGHHDIVLSRPKFPHFDESDIQEVQLSINELQEFFMVPLTIRTKTREGIINMIRFIRYHRSEPEKLQKTEFSNLHEHLRRFIQTVVANIYNLNNKTTIIFRTPQYINKDLLSYLATSENAADALNYLTFSFLFYLTPLLPSSLRHLKELYVNERFPSAMSDDFQQEALCVYIVDEILPECLLDIKGHDFINKKLNVAIRYWVDQLEMRLHEYLRLIPWLESSQKNVAGDLINNSVHINHFFPERLLLQGTLCPKMEQISLSKTTTIYEYISALSILRQQHRLQKNPLIFLEEAEVFESRKIFEDRAQLLANNLLFMYIPFIVVDERFPPQHSVFAFHLSRLGVRIYRTFAVILTRIFTALKTTQLDDLLDCFAHDWRLLPASLRQIGHDKYYDAEKTAINLRDHTLAVAMSFRAFETGLSSKRIFDVDFRMTRRLIAVPSDQLFFIYYALDNCDCSDEEFHRRFWTLRNRLPGEYLVNVPLRHLPEFGDAFNCPINSPMVAKPQERCSMLRPTL